MSLSRELIVAAKARADAVAEAFDTQILEVALGGDGAPGRGTDISYAFELDGGFAVYDFVETASREDVPAMADALLRVLDLHRREMFGGDAVCSSCLPPTSPMPGRVPYPCATVRAVTGDDIGP